MRIPLSWVQEYCPLPDLSIEEISRRFTLGSCEVEGILVCKDPDFAELWGQVRLVEVVEVAPHPKAERLFLPSIRYADAEKPGGSSEFSLVCGADNLYPGLKTLWAPEGTEIGGRILKNKEIMGVLSQGMLCSERELGLSNGHDGIIDLSKFVAQQGAQKFLGMAFSEILAHYLHPGQELQLDGYSIDGIEFILNVDNKSLTHRPDMWGICGIAREFGAVFPRCEVNEAVQHSTLPQISYGPSPCNNTLPEKPSHVKNNMLPPITLDISPQSSCQSYCALSVDGIQPIGQSPQWMQQRLRLAGLSVINSVVDVSNYVMLEFGIPNHIFDRDKLQGDKIRVYRLEKAQEFHTLDGQIRHLQAGDTVVADAEKPQVIAGIMGGQDSSVSEATRRILLEVAVWSSSDVHKTSMRLGLRTDSSLRYEKSLDPFAIEHSLWRLCVLLLKLHPQAQVCGDMQCYYQNEEGRQGLRIATSIGRISQILGYPLSGDRGRQLVCQIFANLGFTCEPTEDDGIEVHVPSYRSSKDISREEDLVEEIGRIIGFDNIVPRAPLATVRPVALGAGLQLARSIRNFLALNGSAQEVLSYPLVGERLLEKSRWNERNETLCLANPLNPEQDRMRPSLIPSHLSLVGRNAANRQNFCIFELGRSYHPSSCPSPQSPQEQQHLLLSAYSEKENPLLQLRNLCERLLHYLGLPGRWENSWQDLSIPEHLFAKDWPGLHPHERLHWQRSSRPDSLPQHKYHEALHHAILFSLHPSLLHDWKLRGKLAMACIPLGAVKLPKDELPHIKKSPVPFRAPSRFPAVEFDCTVVLQPRILAAEAVGALYRHLEENPELQRMAGLLDRILVRSVFPVPERIGLAPGSRWLTLQCIFTDYHATLDSQEIKQLEEQTLTILNRAGFPLKMEHAD